MDREFTRQIHGTHYRVTVRLYRDGAAFRLRPVIGWTNGFSGGQRNGELITVSADTARAVMGDLTPRWAIADLLQEAGCEEGMAGVIRGF